MDATVRKTEDLGILIPTKECQETDPLLVTLKYRKQMQVEEGKKSSPLDFTILY